MARAAMDQIDSQAELKSLFQLAREGDNSQLLQSLDTIESHDDWPVPAREHILHAFATGLGDLPAGSVNSEVIDYLVRYEPRTIVPHSDHARIGVPLYNIRAATMGSLNEWRRQSAFKRSRQLLALGSEAWLDAYQSAGPQQKKGFRDALETLSGEQLNELGQLSLQLSRNDASLVSIAAWSGLLRSDPALFREALVSTRGPELTHLIKAASTGFSDPENYELLSHLILHAPPGTAALAIAVLAPARLDQHDFTELMFDTLSDQGLGAAAALVLASGTSPDIQQRLKDMAARKDSLASSRAALAMKQSARIKDPR